MTEQKYDEVKLCRKWLREFDHYQPTVETRQGFVLVSQPESAAIYHQPGVPQQLVPLFHRRSDKVDE